MNIDEIAHLIAEFAIDQRDNVNGYSAIKEKVIELLGDRSGEVVKDDD